MKKVIESLPGAKTTVVTIIVCLILTSLMTGGIHPKVLLGLAIAVLILTILTIRNYDPDSFEAWNDPKAYSYRMDRDKLFRRLKALTEAVEADSNIVAPNNVAVRASEARETLNQVAGRYKSRAR